MKSFSFLMLFVLIEFQAEAQEYHSLISESKLWRAIFPGFIPSYHYDFFDSDTIFENNTYSILNRIPVSDPTDTTVLAYIREDVITKRVYYYDTADSTERLLYDFDAVAGDVLSIQPPVYYSAPINFIIESVDSILFLDGDYRKRMKVVRLNCFGSFECPFEYWYEGVGSTFGILGVGQGPLISVDAGCCNLLCYYENYDLQFTLGGSCPVLIPPFGDLNGDGDVDVLDFEVIVNDFGCTGSCDGDFNGDGIVNLEDLMLFLEVIG